MGIGQVDLYRLADFPAFKLNIMTLTSIINEFDILRYC
jgi:hypothetical protein